MLYKEFVRSMFDKHRDTMAAKDIMKLAAKEWPAVRDGGPMKKPMKKEMKKQTKKEMKKPMKKEMKAGALSKSDKGLFSDLGSVLGGIGSVVDPIVSLASGHGLKPKAKAPRKARKARKAKGKGIVGGGPVGGSLLGDILGFGLEQPKRDEKIPKNKKLSTFYQFGELPESNYNKNQLVNHPVEMGGNFLDDILPMLSVAML